jgi:DUF1680 family protein
MRTGLPVFGPGKKHVAPGHEVVEMGLVKLYRITGKKEYLETAKDFIEERGRYKGYDPKAKDPFKNGSYWQDHIPVTDQKGSHRPCSKSRLSLRRCC